MLLSPERRLALRLSAEQVAATSDALAYQLRKVGMAPLEGAEQVLALRDYGALADRFALMAAEQAHAETSLDDQELQRVRLSAVDYIAERDGDSYQSPEERQRLVALMEVCELLA